MENTTAVSYVNKQVVLLPSSINIISVSISVAILAGYSSLDQAHTRIPQCDRRPSVQVLEAYQHRMESPSRDDDCDLQIVWSPSSGHVRFSQKFITPPVHVSGFAAQLTGGGCSVNLVGAVDVHGSHIWFSCVWTIDGLLPYRQDLEFELGHILDGKS